MVLIQVCACVCVCARVCVCVCVYERIAWSPVYDSSLAGYVTMRLCVCVGGCVGGWVRAPAEAVCRLAAARYDWRPPEHPDEADDDIEQPESLRTVELANSECVCVCVCVCLCGWSEMVVLANSQLTSTRILMGACVY